MKNLLKQRHKQLIIFLTLSLLAFSFFLVLSNKQKFYFAIGNSLFGGNVGFMTMYRPTEAEYFFIKSIESADKPLMWTNYQLSRLSFIRGDLSRAILYANKELELYPDNCRTYYIRGLVYGYQEKLDQAIRDFEMFNSSCVMDSWAGHNDLAWFYFRKGDLLKALSTVESVIYKDTNSLNPWLQNTYGTILLNLGRETEAKDALRKALYFTENMTEEDWGRSYPGNDPRIYKEGLDSMRAIIKKNLLLLR